MAIRFHLDEHISPAVAEALRKRGIDATTSEAAGLLGATDDQQLAYATAERRAIVTCDADFLRQELIMKAEFGICYARRSKYTLGQLIDQLQLVAECMSTEDLQFRVEFL